MAKTHAQVAHVPCAYQTTPSQPRSATRTATLGETLAARKAVIEGDGRLIATADPKSSSGWARGQRVFHQKFGYGLVAEKEGNKLEIDFENSGRKRVIDSFVSLA